MTDIRLVFLFITAMQQVQMSDAKDSKHNLQQTAEGIRSEIIALSHRLDELQKEIKIAGKGTSLSTMICSHQQRAFDDHVKVLRDRFEYIDKSPFLVSLSGYHLFYESESKIQGTVEHAVIEWLMRNHPDITKIEMLHLEKDQLVPCDKEHNFVKRLRITVRTIPINQN